MKDRCPRFRTFGGCGERLGQQNMVADGRVGLGEALRHISVVIEVAIRFG